MRSGGLARRGCHPRARLDDGPSEALRGSRKAERVAADWWIVNGVGGAHLHKERTASGEVRRFQDRCERVIADLLEVFRIERIDCTSSAYAGSPEDGKSYGCRESYTVRKKGTMYQPTNQSSIKTTACGAEQRKRR